MAIGDQFSGLDMQNLIGGPLRAAADASMQLADSTANFINKVGFDENGNTRKASFQFEKKSFNEDGTTNEDEMKIDVPMLAIVPIPNLQVDEVNILFDMEVKESEKSESATDLSATASGSLNLGIVKVNISGSVSSHSSNTRSSDNSAKYHVDVRATNHGTPEGLARVLDMMAASVSPSLVSSTPKDANGQELPAERKERTEKIKSLRQEIMLLETKQSAAEKSLTELINKFKRTGSLQQNQYLAKLNELINEKENEQEKEPIQKTLNEINKVWNDFQMQIPSVIEMIAANTGSETANEATLSKLFVLKAANADGTQTEEYTDAAGNYYKQLTAGQEAAVSAQTSLNSIIETCTSKKTEYNNLISGTGIPAPATQNLPDNNIPVMKAASKLIDIIDNTSDSIAKPLPENKNE
ncbi:MAG: DUF2589 domain-containing protein [Lachnospiraceae bacterium]|nr:DUF2589 domain-containing protein [Lachnospiraceae bacterium]